MAEYYSGLVVSVIVQVRGMMFYALYIYGAMQGHQVVLVRRSENPYYLNFGYGTSTWSIHSPPGLSGCGSNCIAFFPVVVGSIVRIYLLVHANTE